MSIAYFLWFFIALSFSFIKILAKMSVMLSNII
jgi:hypothetical protein